MESLQFHLPSTPAPARGRDALCGVVASGNLEILVSPHDADALCLVRVQTSASGFAATWQAVLDDFTAGHAVGGTHIVINDMGATPAVVTLRLRQALQQYQAGA
jgi:malonate decarboxylase delta subunit